MFISPMKSDNISLRAEPENVSCIKQETFKELNLAFQHHSILELVFQAFVIILLRSTRYDEQCTEGNPGEHGQTEQGHQDDGIHSVLTNHKLLEVGVRVGGKPTDQGQKVLFDLGVGNSHQRAIDGD